MRMISYKEGRGIVEFCAFYVIKVHILTINLFFAYNREVRIFFSEKK